MKVDWNICKEHECKYLREREGNECHILIVQDTVSMIKKKKFDWFKSHCPYYLEHMVLENNNVE